MTQTPERSQQALSQNAETGSAETIGHPEMGWMPRAQLMSLVKAAHQDRATPKDPEEQDANL